MTKGALEMGNEEYIIQWDDMTPEAKAKKERLEQDPSFRTDHMAYMEGMDQISTDIRDKVMSQVESYDEKVYTAADVQAALAHDVCSIEDFKALLSPAAQPFLEQMAEKAAVCLRHILVFGTACCGNRSGTDHKGGLQFPVCGNPGRSNLVFRRQFRSYRKPDFFRRNDQRAVLIQQRRYPGVPGNSWNHGVPDEPCWRICRIRTLGKQAHQNKSGRRACYDFTWRSDFY